MVHASMRAVRRPAERVVRALLDVLGPGGTLLAYVDFEAAGDTPHLAQGVFDPERSPAARDHGVFAEVVRRWPGAMRSGNPGASVVAIGARAPLFCEGHPLRYGYGPGSPFAKLVTLGGKVLLLGSHFNHVTLLHHAEHLAALAGKRVIRYQVPTRAGEVLEIEEFDTSEGVVADMPDDYFDVVVRAFIDTGGAVTGPVGDAITHCLDAHALVWFGVSRMEQDFT
jgi:aminoglycoside 3-N-acetyltransferase